VESASKVVTSHPNKVGGLTRGKRDELGQVWNGAAVMAAVPQMTFVTAPLVDGALRRTSLLIPSIVIG